MKKIGKNLTNKQKASGFRERKKMEDMLSSLHEHASKLASAEGISEIVKHTLDAMEFTLGFDEADFWMVRDRSTYLQDRRGKPFHVAELRVDGPGVIVKAATTKRTVRVSDTRREPAFLDDPVTCTNGEALHMLSELAVPVVVSNETVAILNVENAGIDAFTEQDGMLLETLASHVASALNRLRQQDELRRNSEHLEELVAERTKKLDESKARFRELVDSLPQIVFETDLKGDLTFVNHVAFESTGYTMEDGARPVNALELFVPEDREKIAENALRVLKGENLHGREYTVLRKDGSNFPAFVHATRTVRDGKVVGMRGIVVDITERKLAEKELRRSEARFRNLAELLPQIVFETDQNGIFTFVNHAGFASTGYTEDDLRLGVNLFQLIPPDEYEKVSKSLTRRHQGEPISLELKAMRKDGSVFPALVYVSSFWDEGKVIGFRGIVVDITERKQMEEALVKSEKLAAIGETATMVAHDLRNPLQGIAGATYLLKQDSLTAREKTELLQLIQNNIEYSDAIVRDLLDFSGEIHLKLVETAPKSIIRQAIQGVKIPERIAVQDSSDDHVTIRADPDRMRRVFTNLVENAIDAMPQGGTLTMSSRKFDGRVEITISDSGSGMPEKVLQNLWKPLQTTKAKGLGLGLAICKRIVDAHGGVISVSSRTGEGTSVSVSLPIKPDAVEVMRK